MKTNIFTLVFILINTYLLGQDFNGGFEKWIPSGQSAPFDWFEPEGWASTNPATEFISAGIRESNIKHEGSLAAEVSSLNLFGTTTASILALGDLKIDYIAGTHIYRIYSGGISLTNKPAKVSAWYRFNSLGIEDMGMIKVFIKRYDQSTEKSEIVYLDSLKLAKTNTYTQISLPINFSSYDIGIDSIGILLFSGVPGSNLDLGTLLVDGLKIELISGNDDEYKTSELKVYPNPVYRSELVTFELRVPELSVKEFELFNSQGHKINTLILDLRNDMYQFDTKDLSAGMYYILLKKNIKKAARFIVLD